jgi:hypothetical protein
MVPLMRFVGTGAWAGSQKHWQLMKGGTRMAFCAALDFLDLVIWPANGALRCRRWSAVHKKRGVPAPVVCAVVCSFSMVHFCLCVVRSFGLMAAASLATAHWSFMSCFTVGQFVSEVLAVLSFIWAFEFKYAIAGAPDNFCFLLQC